MSSKNDKIISNIINTKKISTFKELEIITSYWRDNAFSYDDISDFINVLIWEIPIKTVTKEEIIKTMLDKQKYLFTHFTTKDFVLYEDEIKYIKNCKNNEIKKILYSFLIYSKLYPHSSNWIKYEKNFIFELSGIECNDKKKNLLLNECFKYGIDLGVTGNKNSIICFKILFPVDKDRKILKEVKIGENINNLYNLIIEDKNE